MDCKSRKIGLFFGSFNPIHMGHLILANYFVENTDLSEIWFIVSPQNPLKDKNTLLDDKDRLKLVDKAIKNNSKFKVSDIEFHLPIPSFTIDTLSVLDKEHPTKEFVLIIGEDNLDCFDKWKDYEKILDNFSLYVYPRANIKTNKFKGKENIKLINAPLIEISSSFIRDCLKTGKSIMYLVPEQVRKEIIKRDFYTKESM